MGNLKNILLHCREHEKVYAGHDEDSKGRYINQGWIECCEFFLRNFDLTEKTINNEEQKGD